MEDLQGAHVTMLYNGRTLLGAVVVQHGSQLVVRHFNGEPWPLPEVSTDAVTVLEREYDEP